MMSKLTILTLAFVAVLAGATDMQMEKVEDSTVSPIADMAIIDAEMKTSTERPPVMEAAKEDEKPASQRHTVADFIIHPLIAFKPRNPEEDATAAVAAAGKQANGATSTTTPSPWQLFGFNQGLGLGSQVTNLAGQVSGWLNDRIQFPGLVETPVRESTTTSTTTTTTPRPDVVVRVQHKASTRRPVISINNRNRPNRPQFESEENEDDDEDEEDNDEDNNNSNNNSDEATDDNESSNEDGSEEEDTNQNNKDEDEHDDGEEEQEEDHSQRPNNRRRPLRNGNGNQNRNGNGQRRRVRPQQQNNRRRAQANNRPQRRRPAAANEISDEDVQDDDEYEVENVNENFYYPAARPSTKRSQSNPNFIQRGQQQLINQIRQLTRGQTPAEVGSAIRKAQRVNGANNRRRQQATLFVNRNGQTIYVAPELAQMAAAPQYQQIYAQPIMQKPVMGNAYPQPPLTVPLKRKGQPTQYITIPWAQLGISPPNNIVSITEGIQSQPLILNIPQSAINTMQTQAMSSRPKKKRPQLITADAVPLLAEASLMDIFKPPQIPPSRAGSSSKPMNAASVTPVIVAKPSSTKTSSALLHQNVRPGTIIEKAPEMDATKNTAENEAKLGEEVPKTDIHTVNGEKEYILVGSDNEPGLVRQVEPAYGDARYIRLTGNSQFYDVLPRRRFTVRRGGRELSEPAEMPVNVDSEKTEQLIPVQIVNEPEVPSSLGESAKISTSESSESANPAMDAVLSDPKPVIVPESNKPSTDAMMAT